MILRGRVPDDERDAQSGMMHGAGRTGCAAIDCEWASSLTASGRGWEVFALDLPLTSPKR